MTTRKENAMSTKQTYDRLSEANLREVARVAWAQATQEDEKRDEIKRLIEAGEFDRALDEVCDLLGAKKPVKSEEPHERPREKAC